MERYSDFNKYTAQDLAADESFQSFALKTNAADIAFWEDFIRTHPEKQRVFDEATELLRLLAFRKESITPEIKSAELDRLRSLLAPGDTTASRPDRIEPRVGRIFHPMAYRIAASLAGVLMLVGAAYYFSIKPFGDETVTREAGYGQNVTLVLPDSSTVILNGNSKLIYKADWEEGNMREVWLDGEAFFDVRHKGNSGADRFVVHVPQMTVEVLGTRFNVFNRDDKANVVLNSGKVKLRIIAPGDTNTVLMLPEEAVEYSRAEHTIVKHRVNAETLTSWRNKVWILENTSLQKIAEMIEYNFGVETTFGPEVDPHEQLAGSVPSANLDVLLAVLSKTSNLRITRSGSRIVITKNNASSIQP